MMKLITTYLLLMLWCGSVISSEIVESGSFGATDIQGLQNMIMSRPDLMNMIMSLQNDPNIQAVLQNPEVMSAVASGNIDALLSNPLFMKLVENPKIKEIAKEIEGR